MPSSCRSRTARAVAGSTLRLTHTKARLLCELRQQLLAAGGVEAEGAGEAAAVRAGSSMSWGTA